MLYKIPDSIDPAGDAGSLAIFLGFSLVLLLPRIFFLATMQKALGRCPYGRRNISPGLVWLSLIPVFNLVWDFVVVGSTSSSVGNELKRRGVPPDAADTGLGPGLVFCLLAFFLWIPIVNIFVGLGLAICFTIFWVKIARASGLLSTTPEPASAPDAVK